MNKLIVKDKFCDAIPMRTNIVRWS